MGAVPEIEDFDRTPGGDDMTICRKCGREIPDGQELCEDCTAKESGGHVNYLDQLAQMSSASSSSMSAIEMVNLMSQI